MNKTQVSRVPDWDVPLNIDIEISSPEALLLMLSLWNSIESKDDCEYLYRSVLNQIQDKIDVIISENEDVEVLELTK